MVGRQREIEHGFAERGFEQALPDAFTVDQAPHAPSAVRPTTSPNRRLRVAQARAGARRLRGSGLERQFGASTRTVRMSVS